ncbi:MULTISPECIES: hypothetical protein [unclassified Streptomyces]|uniref:hypothetical protein n=1 Tax=unclassified Streptomyces TaxID=2593676 RepID=UPI0018E9AC0C|nr:hypothetical protein [Streptomyces sp. TSRI0107]
MGTDRRVRRLVVDGTVWHWTVRQRVRPDYADCRLTLSFFTEASERGLRRRLSLVFAPGPERIVSNSYFEAGTVVRLPDRAWLNLYEPGTARRLLEFAAPGLEARPLERNVEVDGWLCFDEALPAVTRPVRVPADDARSESHRRTP